MDMMMSQKEAKRGQVMELLSAGKVDQKEAGTMLAVSVRQIKRILRRYHTLFHLYINSVIVTSSNKPVIVKLVVA